MSSALFRKRSDSGKHLLRVRLIMYARTSGDKREGLIGRKEVERSAAGKGNQHQPGLKGLGGTRVLLKRKWGKSPREDRLLGRKGNFA